MQFELKLTEEEVNLVLTGLSELPAKFSMDLLSKIKSTCQEQIEVEKND